MRRGVFGVVHRLLAVVEPADHAGNGGGGWISGPSVDFKITVSLPMTEIERFSRIIEVGQQVAGQVIHFPIVFCAPGGIVATAPPFIGIGKGIGPHDKMPERHGQNLLIRRAIPRQSDQVGHIGGKRHAALTRSVAAHV